MIPFRKQYDKIVGAYLRNELQPYNSYACFVGNLLNNNNCWSFARTFKLTGNHVEGMIIGDAESRQTAFDTVKFEAGDLYSYEEILALESIFLRNIDDNQSE